MSQFDGKCNECWQSLGDPCDDCKYEFELRSEHPCCECKHNHIDYYEQNEV